MKRHAVTIGTLIAVDCFCASRPCSYHFLSHAHSDCCTGLNNKWKQPVYCSLKTAQILLAVGDRNGVSKEFLRPLAMDFVHHLDGFDVTLLESNHCPGSVMLLLEGPAIPDGPLLYTGDMRADARFYALPHVVPILQQCVFGAIYLDATSLKSEVPEFPSREKSLQDAAAVIQSCDRNRPISIVLDRTGLEDLLIELSKQLKEKIGLDEIRQKVAEALRIDDKFAARQESPRIHTAQKRDTWKLLAAKRALGRSESSPVVVEFTMSSPVGSADDYRCVKYSDRSSPNEIRDFLSVLKFRSLRGILQPLPAAELNELLALSLPIVEGPALEGPASRCSSSRMPPHIEIPNPEDSKIAENYANFYRSFADCIRRNTEGLTPREVPRSGRSLRELADTVEKRIDLTLLMKTAIGGFNAHNEDLMRKKKSMQAKRLRRSHGEPLREMPFSAVLDESLDPHERDRYEAACARLTSWPEIDPECAYGMVKFKVSEGQLEIPEILKRAFLQISKEAV